ncbi:hypothetical protein BO71DRAFT_253071 [Aspergillus ellipticus CBS 707.79]|uniref:Uncharacterized protein n=1 Tax=Aspergillus ellipticus CBS 707.79 TaxID=1448320 RepID=A0A319ERP1_9EURO|nr:hypothetical protein BO71DRAFT_253071 [Aspergillus ellipticus CBS 707.79]
MLQYRYVCLRPPPHAGSPRPPQRRVGKFPPLRAVQLPDRPTKLRRGGRPRLPPSMPVRLGSSGIMGRRRHSLPPSNAAQYLLLLVLRTTDPTDRSFSLTQPPPSLQCKNRILDCVYQKYPLPDRFSDPEPSHCLIPIISLLVILTSCASHRQNKVCTEASHRN